MKKKKVWLPAMILAVLAALALSLLTVTNGEARPDATKAAKRMIFLTAVEWKGSADVAKEPYPTAALPPGGGYESFPPDAAGKWNIETYRFDSAVVVACQGEQVTLNIFGVNAAYHDIQIRAFNKNFRVSRGQLSTVTFAANKPGIFPIICITHPPAHRADLAVFRKGSGPC